MGRFPEGFLWGASTAAYQVEGDNERSAFAAWERSEGWEPCGRAADSWRLWPEDLRCLRALNLGAYRFSVEWSRVAPAPGVYDDAVLARYAKMAEDCVRAGVRPIVCLHHFSEPAWLFGEVAEGWRSARVLEHFLPFVERTVRALGPAVREWLTFNEPMVALLAGYAMGRFPPGRRRWLGLSSLFERELLPNIARAHREARALIARVSPLARVGLAQNVADVEPATDSPQDAEAARVFDRFMHTDLLARVRGELDFIGVNYYTRVLVAKARVPFFPLGVVPGYAELESAMGTGLFRLVGGRRGSRPRSDMGWEIAPEGLGRVVGRLWKDFRLPLLVTENGIADASGVARKDYIHRHLESLLGAIRDGAKVEGYLHWSLMDNYEWGSYGPKFGLYRVDRESFVRTLAPGAEYYARVARSNSL